MNVDRSVLLFDVLPGQNGFAGWISGLLANILVFPAMVFMLILAAVLMGTNGASNPWGVTTPGYGGTSMGWVPPLLGMQEGNDIGLPNLLSRMPLTEEELLRLQQQMQTTGFRGR